MAQQAVSPRTSARLEKLIELSRALPELEVSGHERLHEQGRGAGHLKFSVGRKTVAYYLNNHHGDGITSLCCKSTPMDQADLVETDPDQFFLPKYIGSKSWVGMRFDRRSLNWQVARELLWHSYRLQAPKRLARQLDQIE